MRKNTKRGDCKEQQLCMKFIDSKESFASRNIRKKPKEHAHGAALHATRTTNIYLPQHTIRTEIHAYTRNAMLRKIKKISIMHKKNMVQKRVAGGPGKAGRPV
jgi:hypothetical protein